MSVTKGAGSDRRRVIWWVLLGGYEVMSATKGAVSDTLGRYGILRRMLLGVMSVTKSTGFRYTRAMGLSVDVTRGVMSVTRPSVLAVGWGNRRTG